MYPTRGGVMEAADVILKNGCIHTMDAALRVVTAVAVKEGRIVYAGDDDGVRALIGPATDVIDLAGKMTLPGFIDSHMHILEGAVLPLHEVRLPEGSLWTSTYLPSERSLRLILDWRPFVASAGTIRFSHPPVHRRPCWTKRYPTGRR